MSSLHDIQFPLFLMTSQVKISTETESQIFLDLAMPHRRFSKKNKLENPSRGVILRDFRNKASILIEVTHAGSKDEDVNSLY